MANAPSPNDLTRQQLDELDALLQRMLALPPAPGETPPPARVETPAPAEAAGAGWRSDRPPAAAAPRTPHLTPTPAAEPVAAVPVANPFAFAAPEPEPAAYTYGSPAPAVPPTPAVAFAPPEPQVAARLFGPPTPDTGVPPSAPDPVRFDQIPLGPVPAVPDFGPIDLQQLSPAAGPEAPPAVVAPPAAAETDPPARASGVPVLLWPLFAVNWVIETLLGLFGPPGQALTATGMKHLLGWVGLLLLVGAGLWTARGMGWVQFPLP